MTTTERSYSLLIIGALVLASMAFGGMGGVDLKNAPAAFEASGKRVIPVDFATVRLGISFDVTTKKAIGTAHIEFFANESGYPMLDLVPEANAVRLNGKASGLELVTPPGGVTKLQSLTTAVDAGSTNHLDISYELAATDVTFSESGVRIGFFMSDVSEDRAFLEQYAPSNLEFDSFELETTLTVKGATRSHQLFTNGKLVDSSSDQWRIRFPKYFTTSSFYLHLTDKPMQVAQEDYQGIAKVIPITVYSDTLEQSTEGLVKAKEVIAELESTYGPFAHERAVIYVTAGGGGMEHCGATATSLWALGHELTHSYFARGVMPANGNAGWIDEAIASWRDNGYPVATGLPAGSAVNLAAFSEYRRTTPMAAYSSGARLMSVFDYVFQGQSGLRPVLKTLFTEHQHQVITTPQFASFLEDTTQHDLEKLFAKYVYNQSDALDREGTAGFLHVPGVPELHSRHPRPFTREELVQLR